MKEQTKISIIMPVYNTGKYLRESISSLVNQSFKDIELICVDDASDDLETREILKEYSNAELPFTFYFVALNKRSGAANARNVGFKKATGVYTIFLDADDVFDVKFLEKMYIVAMHKNADVCVCGYTEFFCDREGKYKQGNIINIISKEILDKTREEWALTNPSVPWNKLCKTSFLRKNNIMFQNLSSCNDVYFSFMVMYKAKTIASIEDNNLIYYRINTNTQISANRDPLNLYYAIEWIQKNRENIDNVELFISQSTALLMWGMRSEIKRSRSIEKSKELYNKVRLYLDNNQISFTNIILERCKNNILNLSFESNWFDEVSFFQEQLEIYEEELNEELRCFENIYLWGMGKRGVAFQKFCLKENIYIEGVGDQKNIGIGSRTDQGCLIMSTDDILNSSGVIVASNFEIYRTLLVNDKCYKVINLQEFCPI